MPIERIVVLANSRKIGARCIAGATVDTWRMVRPVSTASGGSLSDRDCGVDGRTPRLLEIVAFEHEGPADDPTQPENVVTSGAPWRSEGRAGGVEIARLARMAEPGPLLFGNRGRAVPAHVAADGMPSSLALVRPRCLRFGNGPAAHGPAGSPRALFSLGGRRWSLPITDFEVGPRILRLGEGVYDWDDLGIDEPTSTLLTVSLGGAHSGWHHKLVAGVLRLDEHAAGSGIVG